MRRMMIGLAVFLLASPAIAMKVTNLDTVSHMVELSGAGEPQRRVIAPNATEYFSGASIGFLSLVNAPVSKPSHGALHADGLLSGVIGVARTEHIPVDPDNSYAIWPGGDLRLQGRMKSAQGR